MIFKLDVANNTVLSCFVFFCLIIDFNFLIPVVIAQILNLTAELPIFIAIPKKEVKVEFKYI